MFQKSEESHRVNVLLTYGIGCHVGLDDVDFADMIFIQNFLNFLFFGHIVDVCLDVRSLDKRFFDVESNDFKILDF